MLKKLILLGACLSAMAMAASPAAADIVTFDDAVGNANLGPNSANPLADQGLVFTYGANDCCAGVILAEYPSQSNGTNIYIFGYGDGLTITRDGGGLFNLASADFSLSWYTAAGPNFGDPAVTLDSDTITLTATTTGGPVIQDLTLFQGFQTYNLGLTGVSSLHISRMATNTGYWSIDNITGSDFGSAAPEPAGWALMIGGMGLAGAALRRRRRFVAAV